MPWEDELDRAGAERATPPIAAPELRVGALAAGAGADARGAGAERDTLPILAPELRAVGAGAVARGGGAERVAGARVAGAERVAGAGVAGADRVAGAGWVAGAGLPIVGRDDRVVGTRVGGIVVFGVGAVVRELRSCDCEFVVPGTDRSVDCALVPVVDRCTRPPIAGSCRRVDVSAEGVARRVVALVVVVEPVACPARAFVPSRAPLARRALVTFGWLSTVAVRPVRTVLSRPSTVSVRGRAPRRGLGAQTFVSLLTTTVTGTLVR